MYNIIKNIEKIKRGQHTFFLTPNEAELVKKKLKKEEYIVYKPYLDCNKVILYKDKKPNVILFKIKTKQSLRHQDILGSLYSLNITNENFGDIIIHNNQYYILVLNNIANYIKTNLLNIKNTSVELQEEDINTIKDYKQKYEEYTIITSSLRIDTIVSKITNTNRNNILEKIKNKEIYINYEPLLKRSYTLKENDIFSIRKFGKYKFIGIEKTTKNNNYVIKYLKYV